MIHNSKADCYCAMVELRLEDERLHSDTAI
jgi:hypothetical protein